MKREFLELAHEYDPAKHQIRGMYASEKLDGQRVLWDGGITRGMLASTVPWANTAKNGRFVDPVHTTGLWSRYGHPINAPDWFLDQLPKNVLLDGEMYMDGATVQDLGFLRAHIPDAILWSRVKYHVFNMPTYRAVFQDGEISNPNFKKRFLGLLDRISELAGEDAVKTYDKDFTTLIDSGLTTGILADNVTWHNQVLLSSNEADAREQMLDMLAKVTDRGGEGLVLRAPYSIWLPKRTDNLLKVKKFQDSEGIVIGYKAGKGKYLGMLGSLMVQWNNRRFELSGFTDSQRQLLSGAQWAERNPGEASSVDLSSGDFPIGTIVTFRYRDVTNDGIPKEARYWRHGQK